MSMPAVPFVPLAFATFVFARFCLAVRNLFRTEGRMPAGMRLVSGLSLATFVTFAVLAWVAPAPLLAQLAACFLFLASWLVFGATERTIRDAPFTLAYTPDAPNRVVTSGPYEAIRHPFYAAYLLFWAGTAIAVGSPLGTVGPVLLAILYVHAARFEEAKFRRSAVSAEYAAYLSRTGMLVPRLAWLAALAARFWSQVIVLGTVRLAGCERSEELRREQAKMLHATSWLFTVLGSSAVGLIVFDFPVAQHGRGLAIASLIFAIYIGWLAFGSQRARRSDRLFMRFSALLLLVQGSLWGVLLLMLARSAGASSSNTLIAIMMALISTPMVGAPWIAAVAFWLPATLAASFVVSAVLAPFDTAMLTLFGGYVLFTFGGICMVNLSLHERAVGRISLKRRNATIKSFLGEATAGSEEWTWETDAEGRLLRPSARFASALGAEPAALEGCAFATILGRPGEPEAGNGTVLRFIAAQAAFRDVTVTIAVGGDIRWWCLSGHPVDVEARFVGYRGIASDITERRRAEQRMQALATRDSLTGLMNRQAFLDLLTSVCATARTDVPGTGFATVLIDLDRFKEVNDRYGHATGDELLRCIAQCIRQAVRGGDAVARLGGDEFALLLDGAGEQEAAEIAGRLALALTDCVKVDARTATVSATFGIALCPRHGTDPDELMRNADLALYDAKRRARGTFALFRRELEMAAVTRALLLGQLQSALGSEDIRLLFRPTCMIDSGLVVSADAVASWNGPSGNILSSTSLFRLAAEGGLIAALSRTVASRAAVTARAWDHDIRLTLAVPAPLLSAPELIADMAGEVASHGIPLDRLEFAVKAEDLAGAGADAPAQLLALRRRGVRLLLDEVGQGPLDLNLLRRIPLDALRLTSRLTRDRSDGRHADMLRWVLDLARELRVDTVADAAGAPVAIAKLGESGIRMVRRHLVAADELKVRELRPSAVRSDLNALATDH